MSGQELPLQIAYLVNRYPSPSHSFIRREIRALEVLGQTVHRYSIRPGQVGGSGGPDVEELQKTHVLLKGNVLWLVCSLLLALVRQPLRALRTLSLAWRLGYRADRGRLIHIAYWAEALLLRDRLRGVDHLHAHFGTNSSMVALLCHDLGGPRFSLTVHGPDEFERFRGLALPEKLTRASFAVAISDFCRSQLWRIVDVAHWSKVVIVRCGVDADFLHSPQAPLPSTPELLWVGRLAAAKGLPILMQSCRMLRERGIAFRLRIVGDGPLAAWLRSEVQSAGLEQQVVLYGWQSQLQIRDHVDACRGLVLSSFAEGLPVVLMEALARGRPVVATRIAAIPDLVVPGHSGWLVPPGRADLLADAMAELLQSAPERLVELGENGRAAVAASHDALREAATLLAAIRGVCTGR